MGHLKERNIETFQGSALGDLSTGNLRSCSLVLGIHGTCQVLVAMKCFWYSQKDFVFLSDGLERMTGGGA